tara:strand:+ start:907 stop:1464 length:558 start_codon:yes stop_codon:yes gene_type:complete
MLLGYADPPYPGQAHLYKEHKDYAGEVDHIELIERLINQYDGFVLHTSSPALYQILQIIESMGAAEHVRICAWCKSFAAFKANVPVAYTWEPVIIKALRKPTVTHSEIMRDHIVEPITMKKGLTGAKPPRVVRWAIELAGMTKEDYLHDMYPGTGIVQETWEHWSGKGNTNQDQLNLWPENKVDA